MARRDIRLTLADGATISSSDNIAPSDMLAGLHIPADFEGTALTVKVSADNATFTSVHNAGGTEQVLTVAAGRYVALDPAVYAGARYIRLLAGTAQTGACTIIAVVT